MFAMSVCNENIYKSYAYPNVHVNYSTCCSSVLSCQVVDFVSVGYSGSRCSPGGIVVIVVIFIRGSEESGGARGAAELPQGQKEGFHR